jgi:hypothetical protein
MILETDNIGQGIIAYFFEIGRQTTKGSPCGLPLDALL